MRLHRTALNPPVLHEDGSHVFFARISVSRFFHLPICFYSEIFILSVCIQRYRVTSCIRTRHEFTKARTLLPRVTTTCGGIPNLRKRRKPCKSEKSSTRKYPLRCDEKKRPGCNFARGMTRWQRR